MFAIDLRGASLRMTALSGTLNIAGGYPGKHEKISKGRSYKDDKGWPVIDLRESGLGQSPDLQRSVVEGPASIGNSGRQQVSQRESRRPALSELSNG